MMTLNASRQRPPLQRALPPFAVVTDRATRLAQRAEELARAGREDEAAVAELLELAREDGGALSPKRHNSCAPTVNISRSAGATGPCGC